MTLTAPADRRIRVFSRAIAVLSGVIALVTVGAATLPTVERETGEASRQPWREESPLEAQREGGRLIWSADGSARITLPAELRGRPVEFQLIEADSDGVQVLMGSDAEPAAWPHYLSSVWVDYPQSAAVYDDSVLWVTTPHAWRMEIVPIEPPAFDSVASGDDDAVLVYAGAATGATVSWSGEGWLHVVAFSREGRGQSVISGDGNPDAGHLSGSERLTWTASPFVVIDILADDGFDWSIELDEVTPAPASGSDEGDGGAP